MTSFQIDSQENTPNISDQFVVRLLTILSVTFGFVLLTFLLNNVFSLINLATRSWQYPNILQTLTPIGWDFRKGWYEPAQLILQGHSPYEHPYAVYPPLVYVLGIPYALLLSPTKGYIIQVAFLCLSNLAVIYFSLRIASRLFNSWIHPAIEKLLILSLFFALSFYQFSSYGFMFSIERGNYDIFAILLCLIGMWFMLRDTNNPLVPVLCVSIATQMKIYPAVLFLILFWKYRLRIIPSALLVNVGLLLILGPAALQTYLNVFQGFLNRVDPWIGNHSSASFIEMTNRALLSQRHELISRYLATGIMILPLVFWVITCGFLLPGGYTKQKAVWAFVASIPLMDTLPAVSHDYKLVIEVVPLAILLYAWIRDYSLTANRVTILLTAIVMTLFIIIERSYTLIAPTGQNKWPFLIMLQIVVLLHVILTNVKNERKQFQIVMANNG